MLFEVFTFQGGLVPYKAVQINFDLRGCSEAANWFETENYEWRALHVAN